MPQHQQHKERREERHEARHDRHDRGGRHDDYDTYDNHGSQHHGQRRRDDDDDEPRRPLSGQAFQSQGQGRGYAPPSGPPPSARGPSAFASQGGLDRGDFATDEDIERLVASGELDKRQGRQGYGYGGGGESAYGRYDAPSG